MTKVPPHDVGVEKCLVGALIGSWSAKAIETAQALIRPDDLYVPAHALICAVAFTLHDAGHPIDPQIVKAELERAGQLEAAGGWGAVHELQIAGGALSSVRRYCEIVSRHATRRRLLGLTTDLQTAVYDDDEEAERAALARVEAEVSNGRGTPLSLLRGRLLTPDRLDDLPTPTALIEDVLMENTLAVLWGKPGAAKSFVAMDWALSVATGTPWLGRKVVKGPVLYVVAEGAAGVKARQQAWRKAHGVDTIEDFHWLPMAVNLLNKEWGQALTRLATDLRPRMVVIDTLARSMAGGDENTAKDMGVAVDVATQIREATDATVPFVHHDTKEGSTMRGSSALEGAVDTSIECRREGQTVVLRCRKQKDLAEFEPIRLWLEPVAESCALYSHEGRGSSEALTTSAAALLGTMRECCGSNGLSASALHRVSEQAESTFYRSLKALHEAGVVVNVGTEKQRRWAPASEVPDA